MRLFATCAPGLESLLSGELERLGASERCPAHGGVFFAGEKADLYRASLWLRTASRLQLILAEVGASDLEDALRAIAWEDHLRPERGLAIEVHDVRLRGPAIEVACARVASLVQARLRQRGERLPQRDDRRGLRVVVHLHRAAATIGLDVTGKALHKRGYQAERTHDAPLKETLAAALLLTLGYDGALPVWDPFCGSGTLPIEAGMIALDKAPLIHRKKGEFAFEWLRGFDYALWRRIGDEARRARRPAPQQPILGSDADPTRLRDAAAAASRARVRQHVGLLAARFETLRAPPMRGVLVANLPYGERLSSARELRPLYRAVGARLHGEWAHWRAGLLVPDGELLDALEVDWSQSIRVKNGALACRLVIR